MLQKWLRISAFGAFSALLLLMVGCASVTQGSVQILKVETLGVGGAAVDGADCQLSNEKGNFAMASGASAPVGRASGDLSIRCTMAGHPPALGTAVSRGNAGLAGNIIFGGVIGAAVDASTGAAYSYPAWMQLVFGEERLFDRSGNRHDGPVAGQLVRALPGWLLPMSPLAQVHPQRLAPAPAPRRDAATRRPLHAPPLLKLETD